MNEAIKQFLDKRINEKVDALYNIRSLSTDTTLDRGMLWAFEEVREFIEKLETVPLGG